MDADDVFKALADPTRWRLLDTLFDEDGQTLSALEARFDMTRFGVMKHLGVLEEAGLVVTQRRSSDWKVGSRFEMSAGGGEVALGEGEILEVDHPHRLVHPPGPGTGKPAVKRRFDRRLLRPRPHLTTRYRTT